MFDEDYESKDILNSFEPYYELTTIENTTDPNQFYNLKPEIEKGYIVWEFEIDSLCNGLFKFARVLNIQ